MFLTGEKIHEVSVGIEHLVSTGFPFKESTVEAPEIMQNIAASLFGEDIKFFCGPMMSCLRDSMGSDIGTPRVINEASGIILRHEERSISSIDWDLRDRNATRYIEALWRTVKLYRHTPKDKIVNILKRSIVSNLSRRDCVLDKFGSKIAVNSTPEEQPDGKSYSYVPCDKQVIWTEEISVCPVSDIGIHKDCMGRIFSRQISQDFKVLYCKGCGFHWPVPLAAQSFHEMRQYFSFIIKAQRYMDADDFAKDFLTWDDRLFHDPRDEGRYSEVSLDIWAN